MGYFGTPTRIVCDQDPAFMSHLVNGSYTHMVYMSPQPAPQITSPLWLNLALEV